MQVFNLARGDSPIVLGQPHGGTFVPEDIQNRLNERGRGLADTDWHIARLFDGLLPGATVVASNIHRYVIDANRDPAGASLYPGQNTTTLVPLTDFDGEPIWSKGQHPSDDEIESRRQAYHAPYHTTLAEELDRVKSLHGVAILFDCHSIRSHIPFLFDGELPIFNTGTNGGTTCDRTIERAVHDVAEAASGYSAVLNGRFKGGWTTRAYGHPETRVHAIQMEIAQRAYLEETPPWIWQPERATETREHLRMMLENISKLAQSGVLNS